jgi:uncharacterized membrane protein
MKVSAAVIIAGFLAAAVQAVPQASDTAAPAPTHTQTPQEICLGKCKPGDVDCQAACIVVPAPNESVCLLLPVYTPTIEVSNTASSDGQ